MIKRFLSLFRSLNANSHPGEIAHAVSLGFILGFIPKGNLLWIFFFVFFMFVRINKGAYFLSILVAAALAPRMDPLFDSIGFFVLTQPSLSPFFSTLLAIPFVAFTNFNDTLVMGSLCASFVLYIPLYAFTRLLIRVWRKTLLTKFVNIKLVKKIGSVLKLRKVVDVFSIGDR